MNKSTYVLLIHSGLGGIFGGTLSTLYDGSNGILLAIIWILYILTGITGTIYGAMGS